MKTNRVARAPRWNMRWNKVMLAAAFAAGLAFAGTPSAKTAARAASVEVAAQVLHDTMETRIGQPAVIRPGGDYPALEIALKRGPGGTLTGEIVREDDGSVLAEIAPRRLARGRSTTVTFEGTPGQGRYRIQLRLLADGRTAFQDAYHFTVMDPGEVPEGYSDIVHPGEDGRLVYIPDYRGNRIPDFSRAGYMGGGVPLPEAPVRRTLRPEPGDNRARIQAAIDEVAAMQPDANGIRGAVLLRRGVYEVRGSLNIRTSGVVLRGEGPGDDVENLWLTPDRLDPDGGASLEKFKQSIARKNATVLLVPSRGTRGVVLVRGGGIRIEEESASEIIDAYVPVGAVTFSIEDPGNFRAGDTIIVRRKGNREWIREIGMDRIPGESAWGPWHWDFERTIAAIDGNRITIDSPVVNAIEKPWGGGRVYRYDDSARLRQVGVENMRVMLYAHLRGGRLSHVRGVAAAIDNVRDGWIRRVVAEHFYDRVSTIANSANITVQDSSVLMAPPRFFTGYVPRYGFFFSANANHVLVRGGYALHNRHAYVLCAWVRGPNVVLDSVGHESLTWSEPHHRWSCGGLFDNVEEDQMAFMNRLHYGSGHGWAGANYVAWNTRGGLVCQQPPTAQNWAIGHDGQRVKAPFHRWNVEQFGYGYGYWESRGRHVRPRSLYVRQLKDRLGSEALRRMGYETDARTATTGRR